MLRCQRRKALKALQNGAVETNRARDSINDKKRNADKPKLSRRARRAVFESKKIFCRKTSPQRRFCRGSLANQFEKSDEPDVEQAVCNACVVI